MSLIPKLGNWVLLLLRLFHFLQDLYYVFLKRRYFFQKDFNCAQKDVICASGQGFDGSLDHLVNGGRDANGKHATSRHSGGYHNNVTSEEDAGCEAGRSRGTAELARVQGYDARRGHAFQWASISSVGTLSLLESRTGRDSRAQLVVATYTGETRANRRYSVYPSRSRTDPLSKKPSGRPERSKIESIF
jgi:hypothetical protein